jgi:hypothetical protein
MSELTLHITTEVPSVVKKLKKCKTKRAVAALLEVAEASHIAQATAFLIQQSQHRTVADTDRPPRQSLWTGLRHLRTGLRHKGWSPKHAAWLLLQICRHTDFTTILVDNIDDAALATFIIAGEFRVNWYKTFGAGQTILDIAHAKGCDPGVLRLINAKFPAEMVALAIAQNPSPFQRQLRKPPPRPRRPAPRAANVATPPPSYESIYPTAPSLDDFDD